jgi:hypothetical protein
VSGITYQNEKGKNVMPDYAISAVGRASGNERIADSVPSHEVIRFEQIGDETGSPWDTINGSQNQIRIIQEPSSADAQPKTTLFPWNEFANHTVDRLDNFQRDWRSAKRDMFSFSPDKSWNQDMPLQEIIKASQSNQQKMLKLTYHILDSQVRMALLTSIGTTVKNSISTLFRQQG